MGWSVSAKSPLIIRFSKVETILKNQNNKTLKTAIEEKADFLSVIKNNDGLDYFEKITKLIKDLNIDFERLENPNEETEKLFNYVYNNNHYKINKDNLLQMFLIFGKESSEEEFNHSNYSTVLKSECKPLIDYINSNITTYADNVYLKLEDNEIEDEYSFIKLLNDVNLSSKSKVKIIQKVETKISDIKKVNELEVKKQLLVNNKVIPKWSNVVDYYTVSDNTINENLIEFLEFENVNDELSRIKLLKENEAFEGDFLLCNGISDETYERLINSCHFVYNRLAFENLNEDKVVQLSLKTLTTTKSNYDLLREHFPNNHITLIERDFKKFLDKMDDFEVGEDDILLLLKSDKININNKFSYISTLEESIIAGDAAISKIVGNIILEKSNIIEFSYDTIEAIVKTSNLSESKVRFINLYSEYLTNDELIKVTSLVSWSYGEMFKRQHKPTFEITSYNNTLFGKLKSRDLIKSFDVYKKDETQIRVIANY